jgi:hypothetical protein
MVMLAYLFAAFSLKTDVSEGLTEERLEAVKRWNAALAWGGGDQERPQENVGAPAPEFLTPFDITLHHWERNTVQHVASQRKETGLDMRDLQPWANPCNTLFITRNELRSAVRVRSSALTNYLQNADK